MNTRCTYSPGRSHRVVHYFLPSLHLFIHFHSVFSFPVFPFHFVSSQKSYCRTTFRTRDRRALEKTNKNGNGKGRKTKRGRDYGIVVSKRAMWYTTNLVLRVTVCELWKSDLLRWRLKKRIWDRVTSWGRIVRERGDRKEEDEPRSCLRSQRRPRGSSSRRVALRRVALRRTRL